MTLDDALTTFGSLAPLQRFGRWSEQAVEAFRLIEPHLSLTECRAIEETLYIARQEKNRRPFDAVWKTIVDSFDAKRDKRTSEATTKTATVISLDSRRKKV